MRRNPRGHKNLRLMARCVIALLLAHFAGAAEPELLRISSSAEAMGTTFTIVAYGESRSRLQGAVDSAFDEMRRIEAVLSNYREDSEWSRINREAAERPVAVSGEVFRLLQACRAYSRASGGAFDITVGPLLKLWGFYRGSGRVPHRAEIRTALARVGYEKVILDPAQRTVRFAVAGVELDPGGIGKGYAVDRMVEILEDAGIRSALVSSGGSSIYALGAPPGEAGWRVEIRHPKSPRRTVDTVLLSNQSLSTSGSYEKFFYAGGKLYSHIFDPRTGYPVANGVLSVSVVAPRTIDSEAWTKPFFVRGPRWAARHKPEGFRVFFCQDGFKVACAWLH